MIIDGLRYVYKNFNIFCLNFTVFLSSSVYRDLGLSLSVNGRLVIPILRTIVLIRRRSGCILSSDSLWHALLKKGYLSTYLSMNSVAYLSVYVFICLIITSKFTYSFDFWFIYIFIPLFTYLLFFAILLIGDLFVYYFTSMIYCLHDSSICTTSLLH